MTTIGPINSINDVCKNFIEEMSALQQRIMVILTTFLSFSNTYIVHLNIYNG